MIWPTIRIHQNMETGQYVFELYIWVLKLERHGECSYYIEIISRVVVNLGKIHGASPIESV